MGRAGAGVGEAGCGLGGREGEDVGSGVDGQQEVGGANKIDLHL